MPLARNLLTDAESAAARRLIACARSAGTPPLAHAILFGSKARGDADPDSDVDVLLVCDIAPRLREPAARTAAAWSRQVARELSIVVDPWVVCAADLERGRRTPMLVDALQDGVALWPARAAVPRLRFTPEDAHFCAHCLLDWVRRGGPFTRAALAAGRLADAAQRVRADITRLAAAALLLTGDTRHRRAGTLARFEARLVRPRVFSTRLLPALVWARAAYPEDGGRGAQQPPVAVEAIMSAELGYELAGVMEQEVVPWLARRLHA